MSLPARITASVLPRKTTRPNRIHLRGAESHQAFCGTTPGVNSQWQDVIAEPDCEFCIQSLATRTRKDEAKRTKPEPVRKTAPKPQGRIADLPGLYVVTRTEKDPKKPREAPPKWKWTSPPLAGTKAGLERFFAYPGATTEATRIGAL